MKNYNELFKQEDNALKIKAELVLNEKLAKSKVIKDFCEDNLFGFLDYLQNTFYVQQYDKDGKIYISNLVYDHNPKDKTSCIRYIEKNQLFYIGIKYKYINGILNDTIKVTCVDFKPVLTYEGKVMTIEEFEKTVVSQIQKTIQENKVYFQILRK